MVKRFEVFMTDHHGTEKPCLILSADELNAVLPSVLIAPITTFNRKFPTRFTIGLKGKKGQVALDLMHTIPKSNLVRKIGALPPQSYEGVVLILQKMFRL